MQNEVLGIPQGKDFWGNSENGGCRTYLYYLNYLEEHKDLISDLFPKVLSGEVKIYKAYRELRRREAVLAVQLFDELRKTEEEGRETGSEPRKKRLVVSWSGLL